MAESSEVVPQRAAYTRVAPRAIHALGELEKYVRESGLEDSLLELVRLRASIMNGCAYCVDMHTKDARLAGETEQRLYAVAVWREAPFFTPRERAALVWTEIVTDIARNGAPDEAYAAVSREFDEKQLVALTMAIVTINSWNRLAISFRSPVGKYIAGGSAKMFASTRVPVGQ
jgi:AhpD family alkylhydroperoxidase